LALSGFSIYLLQRGAKQERMKKKRDVDLSRTCELCCVDTKRKKGI